MNKEQKEQAGITDLNDVLVAARQVVPADICRQIHMNALGMALGQYLSSTHDETDYEAILDALTNDDNEALENKNVLIWEPFENDSNADMASHISSAAFCFEECLLDACKLGLSARTPATASSVKVARWEAYQSDARPVMSHEISLNDQRAINGQLYIDVYSSKEGEVEPYTSPAVTVEVQNLSDMLTREKIGLRRDVDVPVFHLHFDNSSLAASFFHDQMDCDRSRFLMRLERGVSIGRINDDGLFEIVSD